MCIGFKLPFTLKTFQGASFSNKCNTLTFLGEKKKIFQISGDKSQEAI